MPQTHLPGHLDSVRQTLRPKHQLLVLRTYPRLPKNSAADVRPNGSELSYLLYYASTRRIKLHKVGAFLERKTATDVWRYQSARVLVTLQILTAFLEHNVIGKARGFALIAPSVLRIIREIITNTNDISLIEATIPTWDAFCIHQNPSTLAADSEYRALYEEIVHLYASLAKNNAKKLAKSTQPVAQHDATRMRRTGLAAMKCVFAPPELASGWNSREFETTIAAIVSNIRSEDPEYVDHISALRTKSMDEEKAKALNRRQSMAAVRAVSGLPDISDADPRAAEGTAQEADKLEEEEIGILSMDCLKVLFETQNRSQVRNGAIAFLRYVSAEVQAQKASPVIIPWATKLFHLFTTWTPFQERFLLLVTAVDALVAAPLDGADLNTHILYANIIDDILCSDLNVIGLSIIDVLINLLKQTLRTARLVNTEPTQHKLLMQRLQDCTADLANHVYYSDQVSDMISAIFLRIKATSAPSPGGEHSPPTAAGSLTTDAAVTSAHELAPILSRQTSSHRLNSVENNYFTSETERQIALEIINDILKTASTSQQYSAVSVVTTRSPVPVDVWENTEWLLRDPSPNVQKAYREALTTWAQFESSQKDPAIINFDDDACVSKLIEKARPASLKGSLGPSLHSHRQLLLAPNLGRGGDRRPSTAKTDSVPETKSEQQRKPKVSFQYLKEVSEGKHRVEMRLGRTGGELMSTEQLLKLVDGVSLTSRPRNEGWKLAQPPH